MSLCSFSSSPSKDSTMSMFWGFVHHLLKFKPLDDVCPSKTWLQISLCLWLERVCVHPVNKDVYQAIISTFYQCQFQSIVGWLAFKFSLLFMLKFKSLKLWGPMYFYLIAILAFRVKEMSWGISGWVKLVTLYFGGQRHWGRGAWNYNIIFKQ